MKKLLCTVATGLLLVAGCAQAATKHIHAWNLGGTSNARTDIDLTNTCGSKTATVTMKFWYENATELANKSLYLIQNGVATVTTDNNGEITFDLEPRKRMGVHLTYALISGVQRGHARVTTSYDEPGTKCVVGGYALSTANGSNYGFNSYHINNGNRF